MTRQERYATRFKPAYDAFIAFYPFTLENLDGEQWKDVLDYEGFYQVSNFGRVKSFWHNKTTILKPNLTAHGYLRVDLCKSGKTKHFTIHKLVASLFIPNCESKSEVDHVDGNKLNCCVSNLRWATRSENEKFAYVSGVKKHTQGEEWFNSKLTNEQALYVRENPDNLNTCELGRKFNVDSWLISQIQLGVTYKIAGGKFRNKIERRVPDDIREEIRRIYVRGSREFGSTALGKKYNLDSTTILKIIHEEA